MQNFEVSEFLGIQKRNSRAHEHIFELIWIFEATFEFPENIFKFFEFLQCFFFKFF